MSERAIGIFDSGVGGLTVFKEIERLLPGEELVYIGDTARVPYGCKSPATVVRYALEAANFLLDQEVKMLVVACNTASSTALPVLEERFRIPVVGVIGPGARKAAAVTRNGRVGVIGTMATVKSEAYTRAIHALNPDIQIFSKPCPLFVPLAEEGWGDHPVALMVAREYLEPLAAENVDTLVLGCTHYPILKNTLRKFLGDGVRLVDSAQETAQTVSRLLKSDDLYRSGKPRPPRFFVTDSCENFEKVGGSFLDRRLDGVQEIQLGFM
ncbi:MAG: glutamate racemase [Deltaproteobacteria bacterium]|nr:glutamate racemase [Deltaproteobacteria bacterium]